MFPYSSLKVKTEGVPQDPEGKARGIKEDSQSLLLKGDYLPEAQGELGILTFCHSPDPDRGIAYRYNHPSLPILSDLFQCQNGNDCVIPICSLHQGQLGNWGLFWGNNHIIDIFCLRSPREFPISHFFHFLSSGYWLPTYGVSFHH